MKHRILNMVVLLICCLSATAQAVTDNLYIYRNDGKFNAFYPNEIDSITYSNKDLNGVEYADAVVQEIWTADSVYRIPLSVIDSISVATPEVKYAPKVKKLSPDYLPYIKKVDGLSISFSNDLPHALRINKGDILLYEGFDNLFENGFAGKVASMSNSGNNLDVSCEAVTLPEIYDRYISVGNYVLEQDPQDTSRAYAVPASRASGEAKFEIPAELSFKSGGLSVAGKGAVSVGIKATVSISNGHTYIELMPKYAVSLGLDMDFNFKSEIADTKHLFSMTIIFTSVPILQGKIEFDSFLKAEVNGNASLDANATLEGGMSIAYEDGRLTPSTLPLNIDISLDGKVEVEGSCWTGISIAPSISTIGEIVKLSLVNSVGPNIDFDAVCDVDFTDPKIYEAIKDSKFATSLKLGTQLELSHKFQKDGEPINIAGKEAKFLEKVYYLLPEFSNLEIESDSKSITVKTTATRDILIPCKVGLCILDENEKVIEKYYRSDSKNVTTPELPVSYTFSRNLKQGEKYIVRPIAQLFGIEFQAIPEEECYLDCNVSTGMAYATLSSFEASGSVESEMPVSVEAGFVYTTEKTNPRIDNAKSCSATFTEPKVFKGAPSGLKEGTTYYYCSYICYNNQYYYGDTQCVTTKRNIDKFNDDNIGGGYRQGDKPYVSTGHSDEVEMTKAIITLTYNAVSPSTECGYFLQADSKRGGAISAKYHTLGTVTGNQTVELIDLIPGTKYTYWAAASNSAGKSVSNQRTFKTEPSPYPVSKIVDITDITMHTAVVECYFENFKDAKECGIEYSEGEFTYREKVTPGSDGKARIKLSRLAEETEYRVTPYVELIEVDEPFKDEPSVFTTLGPDITGWWVFTDNAVDGRVFDLEIRANGTTNNFYGVNRLTWTRKKREIILTWMSHDGSYTSTTYWEFRGEFDLNYTSVMGEAVLVTNSPSHQLYDEAYRSRRYMILRKK